MHDGDEVSPPAFFVDNPETIELVAVCGHTIMAEGQFRNVIRPDFIAWCRQFTPTSAETTHEEIKDALTEACGITNWGMNGTYTVTYRGFNEKVRHPVRRLTPDDRSAWRRFVDANREDPMVNEEVGSGAAVRDFEFMCAGLPVDCYATVEHGEITGIASVNPMAEPCDEVSMVFVSPVHRGKGLATSLLSRATRDILERGKQPAYSAAGNAEEIAGLVKKVGYSFVAYWWYWWA